MKVRILEKCFAGTGGNLMAGEEYDLDVRTAERLIARGLATKAKKAEPKKTNRAIEDVLTPEDE